MGVLKHKVWFDLWKSKGRTLQVVLIIAIGAAAIGLIATVRELVIPQMEGGWQSSNPAMINLGVGYQLEGEKLVGLEENDILALKKIDGVTEVEGFSSTTIEWRTSPDEPWSAGTLTARADFPNQRMNKLTLVEGAWPRGKVFGTEQGAEAIFGIPHDGEIEIRVDDEEYTISIKGTLYNQLAPPPSFGGDAQFYTSLENFHDLTNTEGYNRFMANAAEWDEDAVSDIADELQDKMEKQGFFSFAAGVGRVVDPNKHFFQDSLDGFFFLLGVMSLLALILGLLLVYNTINALISQQVDQIGVMKAIGAKTGQIFMVFLINILVYSVLALVVALPLGIIGGWVITSWLVVSFNADPGAFTMSPLAIGLMVGIALLAPMLASTIPIFSGARVTVREAISTYGLKADSGFMERILARTQRISRLVLITISNTFQNKWRVVLMQITLVLSGLIFMMVVSVRDSVSYTFGDLLFSVLNYDINYVLENSERIDEVEALALAHPAVTSAEMWGFSGGNIRLMGEPESEDDESAFMLGVPLPTQQYGYQIREGRWLTPDDSYAVVLNQELADDAGIKVGDWVTVKVNDRKSINWQVVGVIFDPVLTNSAHVRRDVLLRELSQVGKAGSLWLQTSYTEVEDQATLARELRTYFKDNQIEISPQRGVFGLSDTAEETAQTVINQFDSLIAMLAIMAIIIGAVGSIALSGALSLSVMERRREIGVMRAIGASSWAIARLFIGEGLILGWLSWLIALPFSLYAGQLLLRGMEAAFQFDLVYRYTLNGAVMWFIIITVLSVLASLLPARGAMGLSVRESLAYQ